MLERYEGHLEESKTVDHEGTIIKGLHCLRERAVVPPWTVILVDEYQDVNPAQAAFVHALLMPRDPDRPSTAARLTAVGDDWQAIFGFQGGDVDLIRGFNDPTGEPEGFNERIELKQTYRLGQLIADTTRHFVTRAQGQSTARLSARRRESPIRGGHPASSSRRPDSPPRETGASGGITEG